MKSMDATVPVSLGACLGERAGTVPRASAPTAVEIVTEIIVAYEDRLSRLRVALENARICVGAERWDEFEEIVNEAFRHEHAEANRR